MSAHVHILIVLRELSGVHCFILFLLSVLLMCICMYVHMDMPGARGGHKWVLGLLGGMDGCEPPCED